MKTARLACLVVAAFGASLLASSPSAAETDAELEAHRVSHDHTLCKKYGHYEEGTDEFAQCLADMAKRRADAKEKEKAERREASSQARALSAAEKNACGTRNEVVNGGGRGLSNAHETGVGTCGH